MLSRVVSPIGCTPLHEAVKHWQDDCIRFLIKEKKANINFLTNEENHTLNMAVLHSQRSTVCHNSVATSRPEDINIVACFINPAKVGA